MSMTTANWNRVKARWFYASIFEFRVDGYRLTLEKYIRARGTIAYYVYVDGRLKGEWYNECEERRRFFCKRSLPFYTPAQRKKLKGVLSKKKREQTFDVYVPYWRSFSSFKTHLTANNTDIDLLSPTPDNKENTI